MLIINPSHPPRHYCISGEKTRPLMVLHAVFVFAPHAPLHKVRRFLRCHGAY